MEEAKWQPWTTAAAAAAAGGGGSETGPPPPPRFPTNQPTQTACMVGEETDAFADR